MRPYYPHQILAHEYAIQRDKIALFMEMRLGKCIVTIRWIKHKQPRQALIVCPLSVCYTWLEELRLEGFGGNSILLRGSHNEVNYRLSSMSHGASQIAVTNYDALEHRPQILEHPWDCVVLDESTAIRNPKTNRTKRLIRAFSDVPMKAILSGMPNPQSAMDYCEQFRFLYGEFMGYATYWKFKYNCQSSYGPYEWRFNDGVRREIHHFVKEHAFVQTRKQAGVDVDKVREVRYFDLPADQRSAYKMAESEYVLGDVETKWAPSVQMWLRQLCGGGLPDYPNLDKAKEISNLMKGELSNEAIVIWFAFREEMNLVERYLIAKKHVVTHVHGGTGTTLREHRRLAFQRGDFDAILCQVDCSKYGLDLSYADTAINYSRSWNPESNWQSEDRIVSIQKDNLLYIDLVMKDTVEEYMRYVLFDKRKESDTFSSRLKARLQSRLEVPF